MAGLFCGLMIAATVYFCGMFVGMQMGWEMMHEGKATCQTTIDGKSYCVRKSEVKP